MRDISLAFQAAAICGYEADIGGSALIVHRSKRMAGLPSGGMHGNDLLTDFCLSRRLIDSKTPPGDPGQQEPSRAPLAPRPASLVALLVLMCWPGVNTAVARAVPSATLPKACRMARSYAHQGPSYGPGHDRAGDLEDFHVAYAHTLLVFFWSMHSRGASPFVAGSSLPLIEAPDHPLGAAESSVPPAHP